MVCRLNLASTDFDKAAENLQRTAQSYKEFKIVTFYDETMEHVHASVSKGNHEQAGRLMC